MTERILVAYDGSELSKKAVGAAKKQASRIDEAEVHVVSVVQPTGPNTNVLISNEFTNEAAENTREMLGEVQEDLERSNIKAVTKAMMAERKDNPGKSICQYARYNGIDIMIVGSRGLGNLKGIFLGSVSHEIVKEATVPVLIIK